MLGRLDLRIDLQITEALPTADSVLQLEPEELAPYLLDYLAENKNRLHPNNLFESSIGDSVLRHCLNDTRVEEALREAWSWLIREGLLVERRGGWHLPRGSLHPVIAERVWSAFVRGEYETAVFQAFKEVEVAVREGGRFLATDIGTTLMGKAFRVQVGPLADASLPEAEQLAMVNLFTGSVGLFKNLSSHRHVALSDAGEASEMIGLASLLMRIVDTRVAAGTEATA